MENLRLLQILYKGIGESTMQFQWNVTVIGMKNFTYQISKM